MCRKCHARAMPSLCPPLMLGRELVRELQSLPRAYIGDPRPPPQLQRPSSSLLVHQSNVISPLFAVTVHGRLGLGLGPATTGLPTPLLHVHRTPLVPISRPTPWPPRRSARIIEKRHRPKLLAPPVAANSPPLPSSPRLPSPLNGGGTSLQSRRCPWLGRGAPEPAGPLAVSLPCLCSASRENR